MFFSGLLDLASICVKKIVYLIMKKKSILIIVIVLICFTQIINAQEIKIGNQIWSAKNLEVIKFRNGDPITEAKSFEMWILYAKEGKPAWCYYNNDSSKGKLYNFYAVIDKRGICPIGYHIPSIEEWSILNEYLGGQLISGKKLKSKNGWSNNANGSNESGFNAYPCGWRFQGKFNDIGNIGFWWSSTKHNDTEFAHYVYTTSESPNTFYTYFKSFKSDGISIRYLKD